MKIEKKGTGWENKGASGVGKGQERKTGVRVTKSIIYRHKALIMKPFLDVIDIC